MPFNGSGGFVSIGAPDFPAVNGQTILAAQYNNQLNDIFTGLGNAVTRDGQSPATADLPMGGFKHTNAASAVAAGQYLVYGQALNGSSGTFSGAVSAGSLSVTGNTTLGDAAGDTLTVNGSATSWPGNPTHSGTHTFSSPLLLSAGSVGAPSLAQTGDTNNGWWFPGADVQAWSIAGAEAMRLNATGLGIGVTPLSALHIKTALSTSMRIESTTARGSGQVAFAFYDPTGLKSYIGHGQSNDTFHIYNGLNAALNFYTNAALVGTWNATGELGIGTIAAAGVKLDFGTSTGGVIGGVGNIGGFADTGAYSIWAGRSTLNGGYVQVFGGSHASTPSLIVFGRNSTESGRFDANGNFGIGVTPTSLLDMTKAGQAVTARVRAAAGFAAAVQIGGNGVAMGSASFDLQMDASSNVDIVNRSNTRMSLYTNAAERLQITAAGLVDLKNGSGALRLNSHVSRFESAEQTCPTTNLTAVALAHGGSRAPDQTRIYLRCTTAELGYSIGDEYCITDMDPGLNDRFFGHWANATTVNYWWVMGTNSAPAIRQKGTATLTTVTTANWRVVVRCLWL